MRKELKMFMVDIGYAMSKGTKEKPYVTGDDLYAKYREYITGSPYSIKEFHANMKYAFNIGTEQKVIDGVRKTVYRADLTAKKTIKEIAKSLLLEKEDGRRYTRCTLNTMDEVEELKSLLRPGEDDSEIDEIIIYERFNERGKVEMYDLKLFYK